jgi:predicted flavoprotein YhiN
MKTVAIIGGGAAGMMAAVCCAEKMAESGGSGKDADSGSKGKVVLLERNDRLGAKVVLSGGGRCNLTTGLTDVKKVLENYPRGAKFLTGAMFAFSPQKVQEWFIENGIKLKTEADLRVFPVSNDGREVVTMFERKLRESGVEVRFGSVVSGIKDAGVSADGAGANGAGAFANGAVGESGTQGSFSAARFEISFNDGKKMFADAVILACGGNAYGFTGSRGDGYDFARGFGHTIKPLAPSLSSFSVTDGFVSRLAGVSFPGVVLTFEGAKLYERSGGFVFTHHGVSGPAVFALSAMAAYEPIDGDKKPKIKINFFPDLKEDELKKKIQSMTEKDGRKSVVNFLDMLLSRSLSEVIAEKLRLHPDLRAADLSREQREKLVEQLSAFDLTVKGRGSGDEFVTAGGVDTDEVDGGSMQSKLRPGLFFAGELLDIDGFTGGFNLQASWATGRMAGVRAAEYVFALI